MRIIPGKGCEEWVAERLQEPFSWGAVQQRYRHGYVYKMPADSGAKTALARSVWSILDSTRSGLLWITDWSIFPSAENMALFDAYRSGIGEKRTLSDAPGHLYGAGDAVHIESLLGTAFYFYWDASVFDSGDLWITTSHDEVLSVMATDPESARAAHAQLEAFKLVRIS